MAARLFVWFTIGNGKNLNAAKFSLPISNITVLVQLHKDADAAVMFGYSSPSQRSKQIESDRIESLVPSPMPPLPSSCLPCLPMLPPTNDFTPRELRPPFLAGAPPVQVFT